MPLPLGFQHSYRALPERFYAALPPTPVREPRLVAFNRPLARDLGLDPGAVEAHAAEMFSGNRLPPDASPLALAYAGHQFGHFVPQLGDGRAILLGELVDSSGVPRDLQLKGSGRTPFSRGGDGRAALGPVLREYLVSEAMHALGIPTTRSLAAVLSGEPVFRDDALPGAVLTRVAASHLRVGTFQYFAARGDTEGVGALAQYAMARHYPEAASAPIPALALLAAVCERQAALVARWMMVGFVHGVMNTDNTAISGETIDYGPCAFMDAYHPETVFSSIDHQGRYAFANQPGIAQWNLTRLAECLLPLIDPDSDRAVSLATEVIEAFAGRFQRHWTHGMRAKLGLATQEEGDAALASELLELLQGAQADYTLAFRRLCDAAEDTRSQAPLLRMFGDAAPLEQWLVRWHDRLSRDTRYPAERAVAMRGANPAVIPRNHRLEAALQAAVAEGDMAPFFELFEVLQSPWALAPGREAYGDPPPSGGGRYRTFCGT
ncbi:MAG: protein adenylyltransferase SelO [Betaproteobacteria bacterium]